MVDQGRLVAERPGGLRRCGSSCDGLLQDTVGTARETRQCNGKLDVGIALD